MASQLSTSSRDAGTRSDSGPSACEELWQLRPGVQLASDGQAMHLVRIDPWRHGQTLGRPSTLKRALLTRLSGRPATALPQRLRGRPGPPAPDVDGGSEAVAHALRSCGVRTVAVALNHDPEVNAAMPHAVHVMCTDA